MDPDSLRVRLHLRLVRVLAVLVDSVDRLEVEAVSTRSRSSRRGRGRGARTAGSRPAPCTTGSMSCAGSPKASPSCDGTCNAVNPTA